MKKIKMFGCLCFFLMGMTQAFSQCSPITISVIAAVDPDCNIPNGSIVVYADGEHPPFYYTWDDGQTGTVAIGLSAGFYQVHVVDSVGCTASAQITLENPTLGPDADVVVSDVLCFGQATGTISLQNLTAYPPYHYTWDTGDTTAQLENLSAGMYNVLVSDSSGCFTFLTGIVQQPDSFYVVATVDVQNPNNLMASAAAFGGTPPYYYQWSNGDVGNVADSLQDGQSYTLAVTDANSCKINQSVTISVADIAPSISLENIQLFPNPTKQTFYLQSAYFQHFPYYLTLYNLQGQKIWEQTWQENGETFTLPTLPSGLYQLQVENEQQRLWLKMWVE